MNNNRQVPPPGPGISVGDIYYAIFRHKWKIVLMSMMGLLAAGAIYHKKAPLYESEAELLIKYVPETTQLALPGDNPGRMIVPDSDGEDVVNSEIRILTSLDVAEEAASNIGPANVLAKVGGPVSVAAAANYIHLNLDAEPADTRSSVMVITLKHRDPQIVQPLLQAVINAYLQKHYEIHSASSQSDEALTMEQSELSVRLNATEQQLADIQNKFDIISLTDSQKNLAAEISKVQEEILDARADLSGDEAAAKQTGTRQTSDLQTTNRVPSAIPQDAIDAYVDASGALETYRKKEQDYLSQGFTRSNSMLQGIEEQIAIKENEKDSLEKKYPQIGGLVPTAVTIGSTVPNPMTDPRLQLAQIEALKAKINTWEAQLAELQTQATNLNNLAPTITQLQQTESLLEANYQTLSVGLEKSHMDEQLPGKTPNIRPVQEPSPPGRDWKKTYKMMAMAVFGGIFGGIAWALLIEMVLDRSVKRPVEVQRRLKLPLFLSIPNVNRNGYARLARTAAQSRLLLNGAGAARNSEPAAGANSNGQVVSLEQNPSLLPFYHALRDRLILYFEVKNFTHKPKLVAVTGAGRGTGVSTIASGLAASLSEIGDGNVLLIDMHMENGAAQQFYKGKACCGLDTVLASETKKEALMQENLYVVNGNADQGGMSPAMPKRFTTLVPKLKTSEYDYIIFDMPEVSPASVTSHLARFMDITLLVVESEKTGREAVEQANAWLTEVGASVGIVLNKTHQYVPKQLHQDS